MKDTKQQWFKEAKYGLFIHWGLYSILAGEWKGRETESIGEWIMCNFDIPVEEYEKLAAEFNPVNWNADELVRRAKEDWGMKYIVITTKHHDGFALYDSACSDYNVVKATPFKRDIIKELQLACEKYDVKLGFYYSQAQDWHDPDGYMARHDNSQKNFRDYLERKCKPQLAELLTNYGDVCLIWFDTPMTMTEEESQELFDFVKSYQPNCLVSGRIGNNLGEYMSTGDNFIPLMPYDGDWEVPATLNDTWGFKKNDHNWKPAEKITDLLLKINSRGGNYLLNIGPDALGNVPQPSIDILNQVGTFVKNNADAIYGTKAVPCPIYDLDWVTITGKPHKLFLNVTKPVRRCHISNINNTVKRAYMLETGEELEFSTATLSSPTGNLNVVLPEEYKTRSYYTICLEIEEETLVNRDLDW